MSNAAYSSNDCLRCHCWAFSPGLPDAVGLETDLRRELSDGELARARELARRYAGGPL
jgi:hypothetical protein